VHRFYIDINYTPKYVLLTITKQRKSSQKERGERGGGKGENKRGKKTSQQ